MLARIAFAAALEFAIVVSGCDAPCTIDGQIAEYAGDVELIDCGELEDPPQGTRDDAAWGAARECILSSELARTPYVVRYEQFTIEGANQYAFVGLGTAESWRVLWFVRSVVPTGRARAILRYECTHVEDRSSSECRGAGTICVSCINKVLAGSCSID